MTLHGGSGAILGLKQLLGVGFQDWQEPGVTAADLQVLDERLATTPGGVAVIDWCQLERMRGMPSHSLLDAAWQAREQGLAPFLRMLARNASPLELYALAPRPGLDGYLKELREWLKVGSYNMRALALARAVREVGAMTMKWGAERRGALLWARRRLSEFAEILSDMELESRGRLWWEVWGAAQALQPWIEPCILGEALRDVVCAEILACSGPSPPLGTAWASRNSGWESVLVNIAFDVQGAKRQELIARFLEELRQRFRGEVNSLPKLATPAGMRVAQSLGAVLVEEADGRTWWRDEVDQILDRATDWPRGRREYADLDRIAWLLVVGGASAAALCKHGELEKSSRLAGNVLSTAEQYIKWGQYDSVSHCDALPHLPWNLGIATRALSLCEREGALVKIASDLTSVEGLESLVRAAEGYVTPKSYAWLRRCLNRRRAFDVKLNGPSVSGEGLELVTR